MYNGTTSAANNQLMRREQVTADKAFEAAIASGRLSEEPAAANYVGKYMYMGYYNRQDNFKNINTRAYDV
jgi:hypothetical protein